MAVTIKNPARIAACVLAVLVLGGCFSPWKGEETRLTINLGGGAAGSRAAYPPDDKTLEQITYVVKLTGPSSQTIGPTEPGLQIINVTVTPGQWNITVSAFLDGELYAEGSADAEVKAGQDNFVSVRMHYALWRLVFNVSSLSEFTDTLTVIQNNSEDTDFTVMFTADLTLAPQELGAAYMNKTIRLTSDAPDRTISLSGPGSLFTVGANVNLVLENITLQGISNNAPLVTVSANGALLLNSGGKITGNTHTAQIDWSGGGGVLVDGGTLEIAGGEISGNTVNGTVPGILGGGIYAINGSTVLMSGGTIKGNHLVRNTTGDGGARGGGICIDTNSFFEMTGGIIEGNTINAVSTNAASSAIGGGVSSTGGSSFDFKGGIIRNNSCYASCANGWGAARGGGVRGEGYSNFIMSGGIISGNNVSHSNNPNDPSSTVYINGAYGGGVEIGLASFLKTGGVIYGGDVTGNDADGIPLGNTAQSDAGGLGGGYAVFYDSLLGGTNNLRRNGSSMETDNMDSTVPGPTGGWE